MERGGFIVDGERIIDDSRFVFENPLNLWYIFALDIPKKVFVPCVTMSNAFYCTHISIIVFNNC